MIVVTGGAGFIGSCLVWHLNDKGSDDIAVVDKLGDNQKWLNLAKRRFHTFIDRDNFLAWLANERPNIDAIFHMGACSSTVEQDADFLMANNYWYSVQLFQLATRLGIPLIYASSAATYGDGSLGYIDDHAMTMQLRPINKYGFSKQLFDRWVLQQSKTPPYWAGLKFFNVYGPQEYHKGSQASVVFHAYPQVKSNGRLKLFKSYLAKYGHGEQKRDFVYVKDVVKIMAHLYTSSKTIKSGIYNIGTGKARTFIDLGNAVFKALAVPAQFDWIEMPDSVRNQYQYFTEASLSRLREFAGYDQPFTNLEDGVEDYMTQYLAKGDPYL